MTIKKVKMEKFGIENVKALVLWSVELTQQIYEKIDNDKKLDFFEALSIIPKALELSKIIKNAPMLKEEWQDMSEAERIEINKAVAEKFDLKEDEIELQVEESIDLVIKNVKYITDTISRFKK
tara:strand:- start:25 stop:393 length:369 start_codon:yes stop_codon:yes gene_type:complete